MNQTRAREILTFIFTFIAARALVFLIVSRRIPGSYVHVRGMHIGSYWQRASFDTVVVIAALLTLAVVAPLRVFRPRHWGTTIGLVAATAVFGAMLVDPCKYADRLLLRVQIIEQSRPPLP